MVWANIARQGTNGSADKSAASLTETAFGHYLNFIRHAESPREEAVKKFKFCFTFHTFGYDKMDDRAAAAAATRPGRIGTISPGEVFQSRSLEFQRVNLTGESLRRLLNFPRTFSERFHSIASGYPPVNVEHTSARLSADTCTTGEEKQEFIELLSRFASQ